MVDKCMSALRDRITELKKMLQNAELPESVSNAILANLELMERIVSSYE